MTIRTTHVGSLPRSQQVADFLFAREQNKQYQQEDFDNCMKHAVGEVVRRQHQVGIDVVSDGEMAKISYATYVKERYEGFSGDSPRNPPADLKLFPGYLKRLAESGGTPAYTRPMCTEAITPKGQHELVRDIENLKNAMTQHNIHDGFLNAASPGVVSLFLPNAYYPTQEKYLEALADAMQEEYRTITDSGLTLQIDCPDLALSRHMLFPDKSDEEFIRIAGMHTEVLNHALSGIDPSRVRVHICWGNYEGPHICDIEMKKVFSTLMSVRANYILFESANPRHGHEWIVFRERSKEIPQDTILVPGVVDSTTNFVEHPELVAQRLQRFVDIVGAERVMAGSDCGFGSFAGFGSVDCEIAYSKLRAIAEGVALVR